MKLKCKACGLIGETEVSYDRNCNKIIEPRYWLSYDQINFNFRHPETEKMYQGLTLYACSYCGTLRIKTLEMAE